MFVLDENFPESQRALLRKRRFSFRSVGADIAASGASDENLIPVLLTLKQPTFFTFDSDFFRRRLGHPRYALVYLDCFPGDGARLVEAFLKLPQFATRSMRMGVVARVRTSGVSYWKWRSTSLLSLSW